MNVLKYKDLVAKALYLIIYSIAALILISAVLWFIDPLFKVSMYSIGLKAGELAIIVFIFTLIPGIAGRFNIRSQYIAFLAAIRRQVGILMFMLALTHYVFNNLLPRIQSQDFVNVAKFEYFGLFAFFGLIAMFVTSNNYSVRKLGRNWKRLHKIVYILMWFILIHVGLQGFSTWTILMIFIVTLEVMSLLYAKLGAWSPKPLN